MKAKLVATLVIVGLPVFVTLGVPPVHGQVRCEGPYKVATADGRCVWSCGVGTTPDQAANKCVCTPGLVPSSTDAQGRLVCACPGPYHVANPRTPGACVWSCGAGTTPDSSTNQCICRPGYTQTSTDPQGRRVCTCVGPYHTQQTDGDCVWSCGAGTEPDNASGQCKCRPGLIEKGTDSFGRRTCVARPTSR